MIGPLAEIAEACDLMSTEEQIHPIGIVGSGAILGAAHLPAYRAAGIPLPALWSRNRENAQRFAEAHGIPRVHPHETRPRRDRPQARSRRNTTGARARA